MARLTQLVHPPVAEDPGPSGPGYYALEVPVSVRIPHKSTAMIPRRDDAGSLYRNSGNSPGPACVSTQGMHASRGKHSAEDAGATVVNAPAPLWSRSGSRRYK